MSHFLRNISGNKLLSAEDEQALATQVQRYLKLVPRLEKLRQELQREPTMEEFAAHLGTANVRKVADIMAHGADCKQAMIQANTRLVVSVAKKYSHPNVSMQDLVTEGITGLVRATEKFDPSKGFKFSTYAHWWIRQAVSRAITEQSRIVRLPAHLHDKATAVLRLRSRLRDSMDREPRDDEVAAAAGISVKRLGQLMFAFRTPTSLNAPLGDKSGNTLEDVVEDSSAVLQDELMLRDSLAHDLESVLSTLNAREAGILRMRYGLGDGLTPCTLEEVGQSYDVTRERIRQIELKAIIQLRESRELKAGLSDYIDEGLEGAVLTARSSALGKRAQ